MDDSGKKKVRERMTLTSGPGVSVREENGTRSSALEEGRGGRAAVCGRLGRLSVRLGRGKGRGGLGRCEEEGEGCAVWAEAKREEGREGLRAKSRDGESFCFIFILF